jgi:hypothetical protein
VRAVHPFFLNFTRARLCSFAHRLVHICGIFKLISGCFSPHLQVRREGLLKDAHDHMSIVLVKPFTAIAHLKAQTRDKFTQDPKDTEHEIEVIMAASLEVLHAVTVLRSLYACHCSPSEFL